MRSMIKLCFIVILTMVLLRPGTATADSNGTVTLDGIDIVAVANYSCGSKQVLVRPTTMTPVNGNYPIWMYGWVYDYGSGQWLHSPQWYSVDGITALAFNVAGTPYAYAYVQYAIQRRGTNNYDTTATYVPISQDIDNAPPFCS